MHLDNTKLDSLHWRWTTNKKFTVKSLYEWLDYRGIPNTTFDTIWSSKIPLKIKVFLWFVKENKVHTKINLLKKGWLGPTDCLFCGQPETTAHLFVTCPVVSTIWSWIANFNNFDYSGFDSIEDLWIIDAMIPLKDKILIEMVRGAVLWVIWLNRNALCFHQTPTSIKKIGMQISSLITFWCQTISVKLSSNLANIFPNDVTTLSSQLYTGFQQNGSPQGGMEVLTNPIHGFGERNEEMWII